jgi:hypothetical protein
VRGERERQKREGERERKERRETYPSHALLSHNFACTQGKRELKTKLKLNFIIIYF